MEIKELLDVLLSATFYFGAITAAVSAALFIMFIAVVRRSDAASA